MLNDKFQPLLEQYDISIDRQKRGRGGLLCFCGNDVYSLSPTTLSEDRISLMSSWQESLRQNGFYFVDQYMHNKDNEFLTYNRYYEAFVLRKTFHGNECDIHNINDVRIGAKNLGAFHKMSRSLSFPIPTNRGDSSIQKNYAQKYSELNSILRYIRSKKNKGAFEYLFLEQTKEYWDEGNNALSLFNSLPEPNTGWCHGCYNHHNILISDMTVATVHFERFYYGYPIMDLYYFLRKALEKNNYQISFCESILESYDSVYTLTSYDKQWIYGLLLFPEKFWKISNQYMSHRKHWVSPRYIQKLQEFIDTKKTRANFLEKYLEIYDVF